jgi:hypothetical protein
MRARDGKRKIVGVKSSEPAVRLVLDLEPDSEPISGFLEHRGAARRRFWGWLDLLAAIDGARKDWESASGPDLRRQEVR